VVDLWVGAGRLGREAALLRGSASPPWTSTAGTDPQLSTTSPSFSGSTAMDVDEQGVVGGVPGVWGARA
jgi:hypothetical protein